MTVGKFLTGLTSSAGDSGVMLYYIGLVVRKDGKVTSHK